MPPESTVDPDAASTTLAGQEFIFDIQGHLLEYDFEPGTVDAGFWMGFPQRDCGDDNPKECFSISTFFDEVFNKSDTSMVVLSALPIAPQGSPLSNPIMDESRRLALALCRDDRMLLHGQALPHIGDLAANLAAMEAEAVTRQIAAWKTYTGYDRGYMLDDAIGRAFVEKAIALKVPTICVHKGFSGGNPFAAPTDIGPVAAAYPAANFVVYHSGYEPNAEEGPYEEATANHGVNRLITSMTKAGVKPNANVYAELGSTWWNVMRSPTEAAHVVGKLLLNVGHDNVVWGTDSIWYGSPQDQIQAFRAFEITPEFQERFGYPALTKELKAKVLGLNGARLYGIEPKPGRCELSREELGRLRPLMPGGIRTYGPRTLAQQKAFVRSRAGMP